MLNWDEIEKKTAYKQPVVAPKKVVLPKAQPKLPKLPVNTSFGSVLDEYNTSLPGIGNQVAKNLAPQRKQEIAQGTQRFFEKAPVQAGYMQGVSLNSPTKSLERKLGTDIDTTQAEKSGFYKAGEIGGIMTQFASPYAGASKGIAAGLTKLPKYAQLGKFGQGVAKSVTTDLAVGLPLNVNYAYNKEGLQGAEAEKSIAFNTGLDLITGGILEAVPMFLKSGKKVASKAEFDNLPPAEKTEVMSELERLAYESNVRKGKITPQNDTLYGNSFRPTMGELPAPDKINIDVKPTRKTLKDNYSDVEKEYERTIESVAKYIGTYKPKGVDIGVVPKNGDELMRDGGIRYAASKNDQWYQEFYKQFGRKPTRAESRQLAEKLVDDSLKYGNGEFYNDELAEMITKADSKEIEKLLPRINKELPTLTQKPYINSMANKEVPRTITPNELPRANKVQPLPQATTKSVRPILPQKGAEIPKEQVFAKMGDLPKAEKPLPGMNKEMGKFGKAYQQTVDNQYAIGKATKGIKQTADKDPRILASNARNAKGTAEYAIKEGLVDMEGRRVTDYSLEQLLLRPKAEQEAYQDYLLHKHNIDRFRQDKPVFGKDVTDKMSMQKVAEYESQYPQFKGLRENLTDFNEKVVDEWLVKGGLIDAKLGDILKKMYKNYVPTIREGGVPGKQFKSKGLAPGQVVKEAVGGDKPIMAISKSYPIMVEKAIKSARKNEVYLGLLDAVEKNPDKMARWAKVVDDTAEMKYKDAITVTDATEAIQKNGLDGIEEISNKQLEIDSRNGKYFATALKDGEPVRMEIHKDLFDALDSLNRVGNEGQLDGMAMAVKKYATNPFKALITGYNPIFGVKNVFRDIPTSYIQGTENNPIKWAGNLVRAGKSMAKNDEAYQEFVALGGRKGGFFDSNKGLEIESVPTKALRAGAEKIGAFNQFTETLPRYGEYLGTVKREGGDYAAKQKGIYNSGEGTVNFARQGDKTKAVDAVVPYLNPAVQGIDKAIRNLRHPLTYAKGFAAVTAPTTALYMLNQVVDKEAYDQLDNRTKDTNYLIPTGDGKFLKVPKSRESGVLFGSLFERLFRLAEGQEDSFKGFGNTVATNFAPSNPIENNILAPATLNLATNRDFADRAIVPLGMINDNRSPYLQYDEQTSEIAKWFGGAVKGLPGMEEGLSPKQIDYLIKSYTGIIGQILQPTTTPGASPFESLKRGFTADNIYNNEVQNNFYEKFDEAKRIKSDLNLNNDIPSDYVTPEEKRVSVYNKASLEMSELRKQEKKLMAEGAPEARLRQIRQKILGIAERTPAAAESAYEQYKKTYIPELSMMSEKQIKIYKETLKPTGVTPKQYREAYLAQKDSSNNIQKAIALNNAGYAKMYDAFEISENTAMMAEAIKYSGLDSAYSQLYPRLKDGDSETKKRMIDAANPNLPREQLTLLYEAFNVSQAVGKYKRRFND